MARPGLTRGLRYAIIIFRSVRHLSSPVVVVVVMMMMIAATEGESHPVCRSRIVIHGIRLVIVRGLVNDHPAVRVVPVMVPVMVMPVTVMRRRRAGERQGAESHRT